MRGIIKMKSIIFALTTLIGFNTLATVDAQTEVYIVVGNYHEESDYMLQKVPASFCLGMLPNTLATAITQPVIIKSNYGCGHSGSMIFDEQINAASCAVISANNTVYPESGTNGTNWAIQATTDVRVSLSDCGEKAKEDSFVRVVTEAIYKTFNENGIQINKFQQN
jgi:hypothetical protein